MFIFILERFYDQNIFEISPFLKQKWKKRNISFTTKTYPDKPDHIWLCTTLISWDCEKFMEDLYKLFDGKITTEIGLTYYPKLIELMDRLEVIPHLKEKFRVNEHYILTYERKHKLFTLLKLYIFVYFKCEYTNDMDMRNRYIKYSVAYYSGEELMMLF
jgi:hypothetical protein